MNGWLDIVIAVVCSVLGSSGLWAFITQRRERKSMTTKMLVGLAHDRIMELSSIYLERKYITPDEYENLYDYIYTPYHELGGNGSAEHAIELIKRLPLKTHEEVTHNDQQQSL